MPLVGKRFRYKPGEGVHPLSARDPMCSGSDGRLALALAFGSYGLLALALAPMGDWLMRWL